MSSTGQLAAMLRASTDDFLARALQLRSITAGGVSLSGIRDFFDLADAMLHKDSLQHCLERLDRRSLTALAHLSGTAQLSALTHLGEEPATVHEAHDEHAIDTTVVEHLLRLFLVQESVPGITVWPEVAAQFARWSSLGLDSAWAQDSEPGDSADDGTSHSADGSANHAADALAAERAFTATTAMAELLFELEREPARLLATGSLARQGARRLAELLRLDETHLASLIRMAEQAGLAHRSTAHLAASDAHREWLEHSPAERWIAMAEAWVNANWAEIRARIAKRRFTHDTDIDAWLHWNYPGGQSWLPQRSATWQREAEMLGLLARGAISSVGAALLSGETEAAVRQLTSTLPKPVQRLYLQHDLTAVATGPLDPRIDGRLRTMADVDGHSIASRYRFTTTSITRAITGGETAGTILEFLGSISLSGVPQPLDYLVRDTASRHGLLRVGSLATGDQHAIAYIRSEDHELLRTVLIDRNLTLLRLRERDSESIVSACERDQLYTSLHDAKYPVVIEDAQGRIIAARPPHTARDIAQTRTTATRPDPYRNLIDRLRIVDADAPDDAGEAWLARQLDSAIRSKSTVTVSVRMPNGNLVDYQLEPISISGGRLRARDPHSEIERTLPLSSIARVQGR